MSKHSFNGIQDSKAFLLMHKLLTHLNDKNIRKDKIHADIDAWKIKIMVGTITLVNMRRDQATLVWNAEVFFNECKRFDDDNFVGTSALSSTFSNMGILCSQVCESVHTPETPSKGFIRTNIDQAQHIRH